VNTELCCCHLVHPFGRIGTAKWESERLAGEAGFSLRRGGGLAGRVCQLRFQNHRSRRRDVTNG